MPNLTENYKLKKPLPEEFYDIEDHNGNMDIIDAELKKRASLDDSGKILPSQLPNMNYIPTSEKGVAGGVATLDENGKLKSNLLPEGVGGGSGKRTTRFTVGSSQYGWTASDCDYLCDGTADDVEINAAIQALRTTGGEVVLLDGIYNLTSAILINKDNVTLTGNGASTKIVRAFNDDEYDPEQGLVVIKNSFCIVKNLYFDGVKGSYASNTIINLYDGDNCIIANNTVVNSSCDGIYVDGDYHTIDNNIITNCDGNGLYLYKGNKQVATNNKITGSGLYGMYVYNVKDSAIGNNISTGNTDSGIKVYWSDRTTYTGNVLNNNNQCGLYLTRGEGNVISGNTFVDNNHYGVYVYSDASHTVVMSNTFLDNTSGNVESKGTTNAVFDALMTQFGKVASGSYVGDNTNGRKIELPFNPQILIIYNDAETFTGTTNMTLPPYVNKNYDILFAGMNHAGIRLDGSALYVATYRENGTSTKYYGHNVTGATYQWVAIG